MCFIILARRFRSATRIALSQKTEISKLSQWPGHDAVQNGNIWKPDIAKWPQANPGNKLPDRAQLSGLQCVRARTVMRSIFSAVLWLPNRPLFCFRRRAAGKRGSIRTVCSASQNSTISVGPPIGKATIPRDVYPNRPNPRRNCQCLDTGCAASTFVAMNIGTIRRCGVTTYAALPRVASTCLPCAPELRRNHRGKTRTTRRAG